MNAIQQAAALRAHSDKLRSIIRERREVLGDTEKQVNDRFYKSMTGRGLSAPRAIMTKVRDTRRDFILNREEAECMAAALQIDVEPLLPIGTSQHELPIVPPTSTRPSLDVDSPTAPQAASEQQAPLESALPTPPVPAETPAAQPVATPARAETESSTKVSVGFYETPQGLRFFVNKRLTQNQFDRLTLAIPEYMMTVERQGDRIHCRVNVPVFDYQAELLTRAIFGGK